MNRYLKSIVAGLGALGMVGIPVTLDGGFTPATGISGVVGAVMVFLVWLVKNEALIKDDIAAVKDLVVGEKAHVSPMSFAFKPSGLSLNVPPAPSTNVAPGASPVQAARAVADAVAQAANPVVEQVIASTPLSAAERQVIADTWAKVSGADLKPAQ